MAVERVILGKIPCPICTQAVVLRVNVNDLAYFSCADCGFQGYTRNRHADKKLRSLLPASPAAAAPTTTTTTTTTKKAAREEPAKPAVAAAAAAAAGAKRRLTFDFND